MEYGKYLIVVTGVIQEAIDLAEGISANGVRCVSNGHNMALLTIVSTAKAGEIKDYIADRDRTVIVTEVGESTAAYFDNEEVAMALFGEDAHEYSGMTVGDIINDITDETEEAVEFEYDFDNMSPSEAMSEIDRLIGDGTNIPPEVRAIVDQLAENI